MPVVITPESDLGKELAKWNKPYVYRQFPQMVYMARKRPDGVVAVIETDDRPFGGHPGAAESWSSGNYREAKSEGELHVLLEQGWRPSIREAMERHEGKERAVAEAAAVRAHEDQHMSDRAKEEAAKVEAAVPEHVPVIPEAKDREPEPVKKAMVEVRPLVPKPAPEPAPRLKPKFEPKPAPKAKHR